MSSESIILSVVISEVREMLQEFYLRMATKSKLAEDFNKYIKVSEMSEDELVDDFKKQQIPERIFAKSRFHEIQLFTKGSDYVRVLASIGCQYCGDCIPDFYDTSPDELENRTKSFLSVKKLQKALDKLGKPETPNLSIVEES